MQIIDSSRAGIRVLQFFAFTSFLALMGCDDGGDNGGSDVSSVVDSGAPPCGPLATLVNAPSTTVVINELLAKNDTINTDEEGEFDDWVELYNTSDQDIELTGWRIGDARLACVEPWPIPDGTVLAGNAYLLIWADRDSEQGDFHADFKLSATEGEVVSLIDGEGQLVDEVVMPGMEADVSWLRPSDGETGWTTSNSPSPAQANTP